MTLGWNTCRIIIDENHTQETVAGALRRLAAMIEDGTADGFNAVALRAADERLVGAASFSHTSMENPNASRPRRHG